jgi:uncharacterized protein
MSSEGQANRLIHEKSPYLLQHAYNPVDWYPWGEEAFRKAQTEHKPIFLSVGYSTCHWCHVMERESFENRAIAEILNRNYVSIKVDREERPDVDRVYMTFVQSTTGAGGWPMSVFLTPERRPFLGGTYFPPDDRYGRPGFASLLNHLADIWKKNSGSILEQGARVTDALNEHIRKAQMNASGPLTLGWLETAYKKFQAEFDPEEGGFTSAPKFPRPSVYNFLFRYQQRSANLEPFQMALFSLQKMAGGGIYDHLGGGFHRYSVDARWHVPHFEKMLYDQAQLAAVYADLFQIAPNPAVEQTLRETLDYVLCDLTSPEGGFYSAEDADSLPTLDATEKKEGAFYIWSADEIDRELTAEESVVFRRMYGVESAGNVHAGSDPHGELAGRNVLYVQADAATVATSTGYSNAEVVQWISSARQKLKAVRDRRPRPHLDDKIVTAWNGLMVSGFAKGFQTLGEPRYLAAAQRATRFLLEKLYCTEKGRLLRSYRGTAGAVNGFAEDYAFLIQGLLDLYEADFDVRWLQVAEELQLEMNALFEDSNGGFFSTEADATDILFRMKEDHDGAEPSANSVAAMNLARLSRVFDRADFQHAASHVIGAFYEALERVPVALPLMLCALDATISEPMQIVVAGRIDEPETAALLHAVRSLYLPNKVLLLADGGKNQNWLAEHVAGIRWMAPLQGRPATYVCRNYTCELPVTEPKELMELLRGFA